MKNLKTILAICAIAVMIASCEKDDDKNPCQSTNCYNGGTVNESCGCDCPTGYTGSNCQTPATSIPDCQKYHTSTVRFKNNSSSHYSYDIIWDGSVLVSNLPYQTISNDFTVASGSHTLTFKRNGTSITTCSTSYPVLIDCHTTTFTCSN